MRHNTTILSVLLCAAGLSARAADPSEFSRMKELAPPAGTEGRSIAAAVLDPELYAASRDDLGDLRVFRAGTAVPHITERVTESRPRTVREIQSARRFSFREDAGNRIEVVFELLGDNPRADGLEILTPLRDYERTLRVSTSADGAAWSALLPEAQLFDYTRYMDVAQREAAFPAPATTRFVKLEIFRADDAKTAPILELTREFRQGKAESEIQKTTVETRPFRMDDVRFWKNRTVDEFKADVKRDYPAAGFTVTRNPKEKTTIIEVKTRREPLTALRLATDSMNFRRAVTVQIRRAPGGEEDWAPTAGDEWRTIAAGAVSDLSFRTVHRSSLTVAFPETRAAGYRLVIHDGDNPPLTITGVSGSGNVYRAVFLAESATPHVLYYGAPSMQPPEYDAAAVLGQLRQDFQPAVWTAGPEKANPGCTPRSGGGKWHAFFAKKLVFGGIIALVVLALGWALVRAVRHAESATPGEGT